PCAHRSTVVSSFLFDAPPPTEIYTLSLHDALPICGTSNCSVAHPGWRSLTRDSPRPPTNARQSSAASRGWPYRVAVGYPHRDERTSASVGSDAPCAGAPDRKGGSVS